MKNKNAPPSPQVHPAWFYPIVTVLGLVLLGEGGARLVFHKNWRGFEKTRQLMAGEAMPSPSFQLCTAQPYLLYIPTPGYSDKNGQQHNEQGYRGAAVPLRKTPGVKRVLCMGGSTTYGWGVEDPEGTWPARLRKLLLPELPKGAKDIEVINAGIPSGTTAEMLTHYQFKFHYYKPDLVILNPGGNDARALFVAYYHPDYSHTRRQIQLPESLPTKSSRYLMKSRLISLFVVPFLHGPYPNAGAFYNYEGKPPFALWYPDTKPRKEEGISIPLDHVAFKHNLETLLDQIQRDGAKVILIPFRSSPVIPYWPQEGLAMEENILKEMAERRRIPLAPFPASVISKENWLDDCHTNAAGNAEKAAHLLPYVKKLLAI